jgi:hypothetical protein
LRKRIECERYDVQNAEELVKLGNEASALRHLGRSEKAECLEQRIPDLKVQEISLSPGQELAAVITQSESQSE